MVVIAKFIYYSPTLRNFVNAFLLMGLLATTQGITTSGGSAPSPSSGASGVFDNIPRLQPQQQEQQQTVAQPVVQMGQVDLDDLPLKGLSGEQVLDLLFQRYRARMMHVQEPRLFDMEELSDKEIGEICGNSASLECGKKVLKFIPASTSREGNASSSNGEDSSFNQMSIYRRCNLRKEFLECIDMQRKSCRRQADKGIYPRLPPKSIIRSTQSKIWRALWTSGGCVLIN